MSILFPSYYSISFAFMFVVGCVFGFAYDIFKVKRMLLRCNSLILFIDDLIFSLIFLSILIASVFFISSGVFRWFALLAVLLGFIIYKCTVSNIIIFVLGHIVRMIRRTVRVSVFPVWFFLKHLRKLLKPLVALKERTILKSQVLRYIYKGSEKCL